MLTKLGDYAFLEAEGHATKQISKESTVISLTGSNPLNADAMRHLKMDGYVVYLDASHEGIVDRCQKMRVNRIVGQAEYSLDEILQFRRGVYDNWYDTRITVRDGMTQAEIADVIIEELMKGVEQEEHDKIPNLNPRKNSISNVQVKEYKNMQRVNEMQQWWSKYVPPATLDAKINHNTGKPGIPYRARFRCVSDHSHGSWPLNEVGRYTCPVCSSLLEVVHDFTALKAAKTSAGWMKTWDDRYMKTEYPYGSGIWGKSEWVQPHIAQDNVVSLMEGGTNMLYAKRFGDIIKLNDLWIK